MLNFKTSASESTSEYKIDYSAFNAVYKVNLDNRSQKEKDEDEEGAEEEEEEEKEKRNHSALNHSVSCVAGYVSTFHPGAEQQGISRSCVEIMHMV